MKNKYPRFFVSIVTAAIILTVGAALPGKLFPESKKMTLIALGDCILSKKVSVKQDAAFLKLVDLIRSADCTWANSELPIVDIRKAYPQFRDMDIPGAAPLFVADEFKWLGIDFVGLANNHTMDYGHEGLFSTIENLKRVGIGYAGAGMDLEEAARPRYVDTKGGRVGQVNCCGSFHPGTMASLPGPYVNGRPGLNPLRVEEIIRIKKEDFVVLKKIFDEIEKQFESEDRQETKKNEQKAEDKKKESKDKKQETGDKEKQKKPKDEIKFRDFKIVPGEAIADASSLNKDDLKRITDAVKTARRNARVVIVSNHEHRGSHKQTQPSKSFETYAKACIDAGADVVFNTGPHLLWGIEIYKGKPIFYSLGNFFFQIDADQFPPETYSIMGLPHDTRDGSIFLEKVHKGYFSKRKYWQGFVPFITFEKGSEITDIKLYPITLNPDKPLYEEGYPQLASKKEGKEIIEGLSEMSKPYKTVIEYRDGVGTIKLK
ncbi:MAG: CapA family protein [Candidatus Aminicenantes bacterium]|nr:CapA family protein [Candidatus Aminicenantes bacterium]